MRKLRPLLIGILTVGVLLVPATRRPATYAQQPQPTPTLANDPISLELASTSPTSATIIVSRFDPVLSPVFVFLLSHTARITSTIALDIPDLPAGWVATFNPPSPIMLTDSGGNQAVVSLQILIPPRAPPLDITLHVRATRVRNDNQRPSAESQTVELPFDLNAATSPSLRGAGCPDQPAPGADFDHALLIRIDIPEQHGICNTGEEDWFFFGAIGGKFYTIDVTQASVGLDIVADLFDDQQRQLTGSDDFPFRETPPPATPVPTPLPDTAPPGRLARIKSFRAPRDGHYYLRVRDATGIGGQNAAYQVIVRSEGYGAEPVLVPEICNDPYEPDGLPADARLLKSGETHTGHRLCPAGDADWVRFFGRVGLTYALFTDTRAYTSVLRDGQAQNLGAVPGTDTVLELFTTDARTVLAVSDNLSRSLDSEIIFTPSADGYYYAQVKNIGDVGDQQIRYDLALKTCTPTQVKDEATPTAGSASQHCSSGRPGATVIQSSLPPRTASAAQSFTAASDQSALNAAGFAPDASGRALLRLWQRSDMPVASGRAARSWMWGPRPLRAMNERYDQAASGQRQVVYFDKGRMEVNDPNADPQGQWFVTSGLLVAELISGRMQTGDTGADQRAPADIPIAGDADDPAGPTYASFRGVVALPAADNTGATRDEQLGRDGRVTLYTGAPRRAAQLAHFVGATQHNIPQVFWSYLNASGTLYANGSYAGGRLFDWVYVLGYPISEAYWARVQVGGVARDVLIQPFERRVLTYSPDEAPGWQVQMGNVGRHYYQWRYGEPPPG